MAALECRRLYGHHEPDEGTAVVMSMRAIRSCRICDGQGLGTAIVAILEAFPESVADANLNSSKNRSSTNWFDRFPEFVAGYTQSGSM
jgi:hypothetical protein